MSTAKVGQARMGRPRKPLQAPVRPELRLLLEEAPRVEIALTNAILDVMLLPRKAA